MTEPPVVDATVVEEPPAEASPAPAEHAEPAHTQALELHRPQGSTQLIPAASAAERVQAATEVATQLDAVIKAQGMRTKVGSQKEINTQTGEETGRWVPRWHVNVEGWQTLATLLGLAVVPQQPVPVVDPVTGRPEKVSFEVHEKSYHPKNQGGGLKAERRYTVEGYSWRCRCEVYKDGVLIGAGESVCSRTEQRWKEADDYAVMGMAQTRATSRAIGAAARWIVTLAGYSATPAEEVPPGAAQEGEQPSPPAWAQPATDARKKELLDSLEQFMPRDAARELCQSAAGAWGVMPDAIPSFVKALVPLARAAQPSAPAQPQPEST